MSNTQSIFAVRSPGRAFARRIALAGVAAAALAGCAGTPHDGAPVAEPPYVDLADERLFVGALQQRYLELSARAYDRANAANADFYALRSIMAIEGKAVEMLQPYEAALPPFMSEEATGARLRLVRLFAEGARRYAPEDAARAQALYDCWLREQGPAGDADQAAVCRAGALAATDHLDGASRGAPVQASAGVLVPAPQGMVQDAGLSEAPVTVHAPLVTVGYAPPAPPPVMTYPAPSSPAPVYPVAPPPAVEAPQTLWPSLEQPPAMAAPTAPAPAAPRLVRPAFDAAPLPDPGAPAPAYDPAPLPEPAARPALGESVLNLNPTPRPAAPAPKAPAPSAAAHPAPSSAPLSMPVSGGSDSGAVLAAAAASRPLGKRVYFEFNSDVLTPEAEEVLADVAEEARKVGAKRISIAGHTDRAGNARYNQLLAMRRAQAARRSLERMLGAGVGFEILPVGESDPAEATPDGVKEARNRRVDIAILE